ncbi:MAG: hypothetical protein QF486_01320 [Candidatus Woesearchaeota archaeon]|jgi:hypothetical protein|nr:hypothetical protein [Candidatus Woesearchaeota archaeon]MDP7181144.1 hypothetical protein [Candidatus Woesearchaeota archaeon]MDP7198235.1 hypothetical protein [Candidatus Woesearchaeota archaeon]MDP7467071.1 hypothetical protein [Candidatus Woesearchaeota archaeon]MDP7646739.1 hypothetical protein [Candidatus Woesearchaeota archaeon]|tara:strand:- start:1 stop:246 length:246 start_codon:yes stop_codon:yes gene_type:complete
MSIKTIQERNTRVEADKAWESSFTRRGLIALGTYAIALFFMTKIGVPNPALNALVPTGGYVLSTLSLPFIKLWWLKNVYRR